MDIVSYISGLAALDRRDDTIGNVRKRVFKQMVLANEGMRTEAQMSSDESPVDIPLYWLVNRDPYIGLLYLIIIPI